MSLRSLACLLACAALAGCTGTSSPARNAAAGSPGAGDVAEIAQLSGIGVTWVPPGFEAEAASLRPAAHSSSASQDFRGPAGSEPAPRLTLLVERGAPPVLNLASDQGFAPRRVTVRGSRGCSRRCRPTALRSPRPRRTTCSGSSDQASQ